MIALAAALPVEPGALAARVKAMFPARAEGVGAPTAAPGQTDSVLLPVGDGMAVAIQMRFPVPVQALGWRLCLNWLLLEGRLVSNKPRSWFSAYGLGADTSKRNGRLNGVGHD